MIEIEEFLGIAGYKRAACFFKGFEDGHRESPRSGADLDSILAVESFDNVVKRMTKKALCRLKASYFFNVW